ncbi:eukaryotic translation initiation factor 6-2 [Trifolium repens]|nr:eukaryotic translation initiation factor 6-2 [Trifolium repens]
MANRLLFTDHTEIGLFCNLTNAYCLVGTGGSENFYSSIEAELEDTIPIIKTSIGGTPCVGRFCIGNKKGLLLPHTTTDEELLHIRRNLPDGVFPAIIEEGMTSYGLFIACNDNVALAHTDLRPEFKELITDVLGVEVFMPEDSYSFFSGTYCALSNIGGLIYRGASDKVLDELSAALEVPLERGTVNRDSIVLASGMTVNDWTGFCGSSTTRAELRVIDRVFKLRDP